MKTAGRFKGWAAAMAVAVLASGAFAQELPKIAVYVTGDVPENEKKALGTRMLSTLVNSGRYRGIERSNAFLAKVDEEHVKQRSGAIDDDQISELGKQFGVKFVCVADITPAFGSFSVSARIINVETAEVPFIGDASSPLQTMEDLELVSVEVVRKMLFFAGESGGGGRAQPQQQQQQQPTVVVIQQEVQPAPQPQVTKEPKVRKHDWYFAPKYALPIGGMPLWGAVSLEGGLVWGKGTFIGIDIGGGYGGEGSRSGVLIGDGLNLGGVYDLPVENLQLVYGGTVGLLYVYKGMEYGNVEGEEGEIESTNFLAPFIKLRRKFVELSYRGLLGHWEKRDYSSNNDDYGYGFTNHQIMLGVHFATSKRVRK